MSKELWTQAYNDDQRAVAAVIQEVVKGHIDFDELDDLVQEAYTKAYEQLDGYDPNKASFLTWLCNVAKSVTVDYIKGREAQKRPDLVYDHQLGVDDDGVVGYDDLAHDPSDDPANLIEALDAWEYGLSQMPDQMRQCVELRGEGYSNQEIAEQLDTTDGNVRYQISASREYLQ